MVTVTWKQILDDAFKDAVMALANDTEMDKKVAYRAAKLAAGCDAQMKYIRDARQALLKKYVELDGDKPKLDEKSKQPIFNSPTAQDEFKTAYQKLVDETKVEVKILMLPYAEVAKVKDLSGLHLLALAPLVEGMPEEA